MRNGGRNELNSASVGGDLAKVVDDEDAALGNSDQLVGARILWTEA